VADVILIQIRETMLTHPIVKTEIKILLSGYWFHTEDISRSLFF